MNQEEKNPRPHNGKPVIQYILVMFIAAFLLMALSMLMHQRTTAEGIGDLQTPSAPCRAFNASRKR